MTAHGRSAIGVYVKLGVETSAMLRAVTREKREIITNYCKAAIVSALQRDMKQMKEKYNARNEA